MEERAAFSRDLLCHEELGGGPDARRQRYSGWDHFVSVGIELRDIQFGGRWDLKLLRCRVVRWAGVGGLLTALFSLVAP